MELSRAPQPRGLPPGRAQLALWLAQRMGAVLSACRQRLHRP